MKVTKSFDTDTIREYGFEPTGNGDVRSDIENQFNLMENSISSNISQRNEIETIPVCGLILNIKRSVIKPVESLCAINNKKYKFLYKTTGKDLITGIISHYLFDGQPIGRENKKEILDRGMKVCSETGIRLDDKATKEDYLKEWLVYKCNQIIKTFIS